MLSSLCRVQEVFVQPFLLFGLRGSFGYITVEVEVQVLLVCFPPHSY